MVSDNFYIIRSQFYINSGNFFHSIESLHIPSAVFFQIITYVKMPFMFSPCNYVCKVVVNVLIILFYSGSKFIKESVYAGS